MTEIIAVLFVLIAAGSIFAAVRRPGPVTIFTATLAMFSIGYYALPLFVPDMAGLQAIAPSELYAVGMMALVFMVCVLLGLWAVARRSDRLPGLHYRRLDRLATAHWWVVTIVALAGYVTYLQTIDLSSYASEDFAGYFENRSPIAGVIGFFSGFALSCLALNFAIAVRQRRKARIAVMIVIFAFIEFRLSAGAQRLLFITPILMVFVALVGLRQYRVGASALMAGVFALLVISPFAVALRTARGGSNSDVTTAKVSYDKGFAATTLQSIVDRSDLIYNMTALKAYVDEHGYAGSQFYKSVLAIPVPRILMPDKPYLLSDTGTPDGEASVLAWHIVVGDTLGSLTAFGSIVAYREGGWPAVILDGLAAGALFALCLGIASRSGFFGLIFLPMAFVNFAVAKVPTSFFEALAQILTYLPIILGLWIAEVGLGLVLRRGEPASLHQFAGVPPRR